MHAEAFPLLFVDGPWRELGNPSHPDIYSLIFPKPQQIAASGSDFLFDDRVRIVVPANPSSEDLALANFLRDEVSDRFGLQLKIERGAQATATERSIVLGSRKSVLAGRSGGFFGGADLGTLPGAEGYLLRVDRDRGGVYGLQIL